MVYVLGKDKINIPDKDIDKLMNGLGVSKEEAIECWLEDNDYLEPDEETQALNEKAKKNKIDHGGAYKKAEKKAPKPKVVSDSKKEIFEVIWKAISEHFGENAQITTENKYIDVQNDGFSYTINLVEHRKPKK